MKITILLITLLVASLSHADYSREQPMTVSQLNGIDIAYTTTGEVDAPPVLLIMGFTGSHRLWGEDFVNSLVDSGYRVILFDNRDTGDSARLNALGEPTLWWEMLKNTVGLDVNAPYALTDMAADAVAVLDELNIDKAHIVGASMGGMIAQIVASEYPQRVETLVSIMSTTGAPHLPEASGDASGDLMGVGAADDPAEIAKLHEVGVYPGSFARQLMAIVAAGDRSEQVKTIAVPTLVLHGEDDALLPLAHGQHTHELIQGSEFISFSGMGHNMPEPVVPKLVGAMSTHFTKLEVGL